MLLSVFQVPPPQPIHPKLLGGHANYIRVLTKQGCFSEMNCANNLFTKLQKRESGKDL